MRPTAAHYGSSALTHIGSNGVDVAHSRSNGSAFPLLLDFINTTYEVNGAPIVLGNYLTVSRSGVATYVDAAGVVQDASANTPRLDYTPNAGASKGLLIETGVTNLLVRTEQFDNATWVKNRLAVTGDTTTSPAGTTTADRCLCNASGGGMYIQQVSSSFTGNIFTVSCWIKKGSGDWAVLAPFNGANSLNQFFNVNTGTVGSRSSGGSYTFVDASIVDYGGGWFRCSLTVSRPSTTATVTVAVYLGTTADNTYSCTSGVSEGFIWGAQLEAQGFASSYVRATSSYVARSSDVVTMIGTDFSDWYNASQGTFVGEFNIRTAGGHLLSADDATVNEAIVSRLNASSNHLLVVDGGVTQADINAGSITLNATQKLAIAYKANDFAASMNGGAVVTDATGTIPTVNQLVIGGRTGSTSYLNGWVRKLTYRATRVTNSALQAS